MTYTRYMKEQNCWTSFKMKRDEQLFRGLIRYGIPWGWSLGPMVCIIYINDIVNIPLMFDAILCADDTSTFVLGRHLDDIVKLSNAWLSNLSLWLKSNELALNAAKTKYIIFAPKQKSPATSEIMTFVNTIIERATHFKFLRVVFHGNLRWTDHVNKISNKISHSVGQIFSTKDLLPLWFKKAAIFYIDPFMHSIPYSCLGLNYTIKFDHFTNIAKKSNMLHWQLNTYDPYHSVFWKALHPEHWATI